MFWGFKNRIWAVWLRKFCKNKNPPPPFSRLVHFCWFCTINTPRGGFHLLFGHHKHWGPPAKMTSNPTLNVRSPATLPITYPYPFCKSYILKQTWCLSVCLCVASGSLTMSQPPSSSSSSNPRVRVWSPDPRLQLEVPKPGLNPGSSKPNIGVSSPAPGLDPRAAWGSQIRSQSRFFESNDWGLKSRSNFG